MALLTSIKRLTADVAVRLFSQEKDKVVYVYTGEHSLLNRSLALFKRFPLTRATTKQKSSVMRVADVTCFAGTPQERVDSMSAEIVYIVPKGASMTDVDKLIDDTVGIAQNAETASLVKLHYMPN